MATLYAKGAGGNWSAAGTWSNVSSAGVDNSGPPTAADNVVFDLASGNVTVDSGAVCRSIDCDGATAYGGVLTHSAAVTLTIGDGTAGTGNIALRFSAGMTYTLGSSATSAIQFASTSATVQTIAFAGKSVGNTDFNGAGGSWQLVSAITTGSGATVSLSRGTLNTNGQTCTWGVFSSSNTNTRTLTLGASAIAITGTAGWNTGTATNLTVSANTAVVTISGAGADISIGNANYNSISFVLSGSGACDVSNGTGASGIANITRTGTAATTDTCAFSNNLTITGTCTLGGNTTQGVNRLFVQSSTVGTQRTITAAAYVITGDVDFMDINLAYSGGASWTNAGSAYIGDCLGNAGAVTTNAPASATQTATGTASFSWSTHGWTSRVPLPQDDVVITNAFVAGRTVTLDMPRAGRSIDFTGATGTPTLALSQQTSVFGSLTLIDAMNLSTNTWTFAGRGSHTIRTPAGNAMSTTNINAPGGTYTLANNFLTGTTTVFTLNFGGFNANGFNVTIGSFNSNNGNTRSLTMGTGTWTLTATGSSTVWNLATTTAMTFSGASATIVIAATDSGVTKTFNGGNGFAYGTLRHTASGSAGLTIVGNNTFVKVTGSCTTARTVTLPASGTNTAAWELSGPLSFVSSSPGTATTMAGTAVLPYPFPNVLFSADILQRYTLPRQYLHRRRP